MEEGDVGRIGLSDFADDDAGTFDGHDFDGGTAFDEGAFGDDVDALAVEEGGAGGSQLSQGGTGGVEQFGVFDAEITGGSLGDELSGDATTGEEGEPAPGAEEQAKEDGGEDEAAGCVAEVAVAEDDGGGETEQTDDARDQAGEEGFEEEQGGAEKQEGDDEGHAFGRG